jgi:hypothetical protein
MHRPSCGGRACETAPRATDKIVSGAGLVFCGGSPGASVGTQWGTGGWKAVTLDLNAFQGQNVILYLTLWSREYEEPYYDDRAWFNTWAYVDNVRPHN